MFIKGGRALNIQIRKAGLSDLDQVLPLAKFLATSFVIEDQAFSQSFKQLLDIPHATVLVAEQDNVLVAYLLGFEHPSFYANGTVAWVEELYVDGSCRNAGVGRLLMRHFEQSSKKAGNKLVALSTRRASDFYQSIGYEKSATYFKKHL